MQVNDINPESVIFASEIVGPTQIEADPLDSKEDSGYAIYWIVNIFAAAIVILSIAGILYARYVAGRP